MKFLSKFFKFIRNIYFVVFSLIGIILTGAVGAFGYISWKTNIINDFLDEIITSFNNINDQANGALNDAQWLPDLASDVRESLPEIGESMFIASVVIISIFVGSLILGGIFGLLSKKNKKNDK